MEGLYGQFRKFYLTFLPSAVSLPENEYGAYYERYQVVMHRTTPCSAML
jgi:hypothetical protein